MAVIVLAFAILSINIAFAAINPDGPDNLVSTENSSKTNISNKSINVSGGTIATLNLTGVIKNPRWKAFVGNVSGTYTLDDAAGSTIYDWNIATVTGKVYATKKTTNVAWSSIACASSSQVSVENTRMDHTDSNDNINITFYDIESNSQLWVGATNIEASTCNYTLHTYVSDASQSSTFEEILLHDQDLGSGKKTGMIYTTILEQDATGYNDETYDFQMIVPEVGTSGYTGSTAYYMYVELGN
jgi:hypothetical protein